MAPAAFTRLAPLYRHVAATMRAAYGGLAPAEIRRVARTLHDLAATYGSALPDRPAVDEPPAL